MVGVVAFAVTALPVVVTAPTAAADQPTGNYVVAWGDNSAGQSSVPASLTGKTVTAISGGGAFSLALTSDGQVTAWGSNGDGQTSVPASLTGKTVTAIAAGDDHGLALTNTGQVTAWGDNGDGQTSVPASLTGKTVTAIAAGSAFSLALTSDGQVTAWGNDSDGETDVPASLAGKTVTAIAGGWQHSLALTSDGRVTAWGVDASGQTNVPASLTGKTVTAIAAGRFHSLALTSDGQVTAWGDNGGGQSSVPASLTGKTVTAIAAGNFYSLALTNNGQVTAWGDNGDGQTNVPTSLTGKTVTAIAAGGSHSLAIVRATAPSIAGQPSSATVASGQTASFTATGSGDPTPTLRWQQAASGSSTFTDIPGATSTTYTTGALTTSNAGTKYRAVFTNPAGTATSNTATVTVNPATPSVTAQPNNTTVATGQTASFTATASGDPTPTEQWQQAPSGSSTFTTIAGATSTTYTTGTLTTANAGTKYRAVFTNPAGTATSNPATLTVTPAVPAVTSQPASVLIITGQAASFTAAASGDPTPTVQWQQAPSGSSTFTTIAGATGTTYTTGALTTADSGTQYRAVFTNSAGAATSNPATASVTVAPVELQPPNAALGQPYSYTIPVTGTSTPAVTLTSGTLPAGLTMNAAGTISGTPTQIGSRSFTVATNGNPAAATGTISVQPAATVTGTAPNGQIASQYQWVPTVTGNPTLTVSSGTLPDGVTLSNQMLTGVPTKAGTFTFTLQAANGYGTPATLTQTVTIRLAPGISQQDPPAGLIGNAYSFQFATTGSPTPTVTLASGTLPAGLTLSTTGLLSGTPTAAGNSSFTIKASNGANPDASYWTSLTINSAGPATITGTPPAAATGTGYSYPFTVGGAPAPTVSVTAGTLPVGLTLTGSGTLSGNPTQAGTYTFTVTAHNGVSQDANLPVTMTVYTLPTVSANAPTGAVGTAYTYSYPVTAAPAATVTLTTGALPAGLTLSSSGTLSGTPSKAGTWTYTLTATNPYGSATKTQTLTINPATTGQATIATPPASVQPGAWESDTELRVFGEQMNQTLTGPVTVGDVTIAAGTKVNSYYVHADPVGAVNTAHLFTGTINFGTQILAVATTTSDLETSAAQFGLTGTTYSTSVDQGLEYDDSATTTNQTQININFNAYNSTDAARIITLAP